MAGAAEPPPNPGREGAIDPLSRGIRALILAQAAHSKKSTRPVHYDELAVPGPDGRACSPNSTRTPMAASASTGEARWAAARVRAYVASLPPVARRARRQPGSAIRAAAPGAVEAFSYRIRGFRLDGRPLVWYAAFGHDCSLYPITDSIKRAHATALRGYETSKGP
jgi:uncharacterized protein YdhG (YjbR/CyaY superfamily)